MKVDSIFFRRFVRLIRLAATSSKDQSMWYSLPAIIVALAVFCSLGEVFAYLSGTRVSQIYVTLAQRDFPAFLTLIVTCATLYVIYASFTVAKEWTRGCFAIVVRKRLTETIHQRFVCENNLYQVTRLCLNGNSKSSRSFGVPTDHRSFDIPELVFGDNSDEEEGITQEEERMSLLTSTPKSDKLLRPCLDNPDQTITQDIEKFAETVSTILLQTILLPVLIVYYAIETYTMTQSMLSPAIIAVFYFSCWFVCRIAMNPVVPAVYAKEKEEGDFRFTHVHTRTEAESIALMHTESTERNRLDTLLRSVVRASFVVLKRNVPLHFLTESTMYLASVLTYCVVAIPVFDGTFDDKTEAEISGIAAKNLFICLYLIHQFTVLTNLSRTLTQLSGYTTRICILLESCDELEAKRSHGTTSSLRSVQRLNSISIPSNDTQVSSITATDVDFQQQQHHALLTVTELTFIPSTPPISFSIYKNQHTLIKGPSGCGKSSLLRSLANLHPQQTATFPPPIHFDASLLSLNDIGNDESESEFHPSKIMFLPQQGFSVPVPDDTSSVNARHLLPLITQIVYPHDPLESTISDQEVREILEKLKLTYLIQRCQQQSSSSSFSEKRAGDGFIDCLSGGEKQRLSIARILYWKPEICFVDEGLSAVDEAMEASVWEQVISLRNVTVVAVRHGRGNGERDGVEKLFSHVIHVKFTHYYLQFLCPYSTNYKTIVNKFSNETIVLYQCGTPKPTVAGATVTIAYPIQSTTVVTFLELLGQRKAIKYTTEGNSGYITSPCVQALVASGVIVETDSKNITKGIAQVDSTGAYFNYMDSAAIHYTNSVSFPASADPGVKGRAEWLGFVASFFNQEANPEPKGINAANGGSEWFEAAIADQNIVFADLISVTHPEVVGGPSYKPTFLRNIYTTK
ncbi:UNVERIFIED_CONTAM: ATP-binding cassette sub- D member 4 [Siphonaria sp. JEL0065]|nr:ATP-binding cassette sub- D member 4 [Siphonaria sp. JEL0065]